MPPKSSLRKSVLTLRRSVSPADHKVWSALCGSKLLTLLRSPPFSAGAIAGYRPVNCELDVTPVLDALALEGRSLVFPRVIENRKPLGFYPFDESNLAHAVHAPQPYSPGAILPDILIVPLVAFDDRGYRLGYGGGYYDATLKELRAKKTILTIGAAFALQQVTAIPEEPFDQRLDIVVTEKDIIRFT